MRDRWMPCAALMVAALLAPHAKAADFAAGLAGRSLSCGVGPALYVAPDLSAVTVINAADGDFPIEERQVPLTRDSAGADHLTFAAAMASGRREYRIARNPAGRRGYPVVLYIDGDKDGDDCSVSNGRGSFVQTRFDTIREGLCGNDPRPACTAALRRACGPEPSAACVAQVKPKLRAINQRSSRD